MATQVNILQNPENFDQMYRLPELQSKRRRLRLPEPRLKGTNGTALLAGARDRLRVDTSGVVASAAGAGRRLRCLGRRGPISRSVGAFRVEDVEQNRRAGLLILFHAS
jgi:hypothetical protein